MTPEPSSINPEAQRIAIAEACGWTRFTWQEPDGQCDGWQPPKGAAIYSDAIDVLPDYLFDLNAMHEAEKVLKKSPLQWGQYSNVLAMLCGGARQDDGGMFVSHKEAIFAPAAQRAEAFLRTLNLYVS